MAFTAYDNEMDQILDPSIGELVFTAHQWGNDEDENVFYDDIVLKSHQCSKEELGLRTSNGNESPLLPFSRKNI